MVIWDLMVSQKIKIGYEENVTRKRHLPHTSAFTDLSHRMHGLSTYDYDALDDAILVLKSSFSAEDRMDGEPNIIVRTKR